MFELCLSPAGGRFLPPLIKVGGGQVQRLFEANLGASFLLAAFFKLS